MGILSSLRKDLTNLWHFGVEEWYKTANTHLYLLIKFIMERLIESILLTYIHNALSKALMLRQQKEIPVLRLCLASNLMRFNSLAPGRYGSNFKSTILKCFIENSRLNTHWEIVLAWMPQNLTNEKSPLVQVMAWCRQATSHYLSRCWPRSMSSYGITRPHWVIGEPL